jgi:hypothetical protein
MREMRNAWKIFVGNLKRRDHLEDFGIEKKVKFKGF